MPSSVPVDEKPPPVTANERAFRVLVRNALFRRVELMALRRWIDLGELDPELGQDARELAVRAYFGEHDELRTGPDARGPCGDHDWVIAAVVDLAASDEAGTAVLTVEAVHQL